MSQSQATSDYWQRVEELFHRALELPAHAREPFLRESCGDDAQLLKDAREILASYVAQEEEIGTAAAGLQGGMRCGAFELVEKLGEGGMGTVYLARRLEDFEQRAAVKLINGTPAAIVLMTERFRQERQILAALEHPNIARVLDGGVSQSGQPYLAMEYVEGVRLDRYCEEARLTVEQRLGLFRKICAAVHFAHKHLVIHRDLKPANILVDQNGEPKLLDFGIAKVLGAGPDGAAGEAQTMTGGLMMTPEYASPEQLQGRPCTVASDIYSLGVILYGLLTGRKPYAGESATPAEMIAAVVTRDPARPSQVAPEAMRAGLRGDLDGIVTKAMAKRPDDRYGSVDQLSEDIGRHLEGLPVTAVEGSRLYIARKFVGRHRVGVAAAVVVLVSLLAGLGGTLWQARRAERERVLAEQHFSDARKLANYLLFPLYDQVQGLPGSVPVRADMAGQSLLYLDRLASSRGGDATLSTEIAEGYLRLGGILESPYGFGDSLGNTAKALESDSKAVALLEPLAKAHPEDKRIQQDLGRACLNLGPVLNLSGKKDEAAARVKQATAILDGLAASEPRDVEAQVEAGRAWSVAMDVLSGQGGGIGDSGAKDQVAAAGDKAVGHMEAALALGGKSSEALRGLAYAYNSLGAAEYNARDFHKAISAYQKGLDSLGRMPKGDQEQAEVRGIEARLETGTGQSYGELTQYPEALAMLKQAQVVLDKLAADDPGNATAAYRRMNLYRARAFVNEMAGHKPDAIADYRTAVGILDALLTVDPTKTSNRVIRAEMQQKMARMLADQGQMAEATRYGKAAVDYLNEQADRTDAPPQTLVEASYANMEPPIPSLVDLPRAIRYAQRADEMTHGKNPVAVFYLAQAYEDALDGTHAMEALQRFGALLPPTPAGGTPSRARLIYEKHLKSIQELLKKGNGAGANTGLTR